MTLATPEEIVAETTEDGPKVTVVKGGEQANGRSCLSIKIELDQVTHRALQMLDSLLGIGQKVEPKPHSVVGAAYVDGNERILQLAGEHAARFCALLAGAPPFFGMSHPLTKLLQAIDRAKGRRW